MRLEKLIGEVMPLHTEVLEAAYKNVSVPVQSRIWGRNLSPKERGEFMGLFYECVTRAIYGGELNDTDHEVLWRDGERVNGATRPDVIDVVGGIAQDSKACCSGSECIISLNQFWGYQYLQASNPDTQYFFPIYRHTLKGIRSAPTEGFTERDISRELAQRTKSSVILPLRVLMQIKAVPYKNGLNISRISKSRKWKTSLCINSPIPNKFLLDPSEMLEILELDPGEFEIQRYLSPRKIIVCGRTLRQFPIVKILDKDHHAWAEEFSIDFEREMTRMGESDDGIEDLPIFEQDLDVPFD